MSEREDDERFLKLFFEIKQKMALKYLTEGVEKRQARAGMET